MEITPEIERAWDDYWRTGFSDAALNVLMIRCGNRDNLVRAMAVLSGSSDTVLSHQHYQGGRTLVPLGFQLK